MMKIARLFLLLLASGGGAVAQEEQPSGVPAYLSQVNKAEPEQSENQDKSENRRKLLLGAGFYIISPELDREIDERKVYLDVQWRPLTLTLNDGKQEQVLGRINLMDQVVEVKYDDQHYRVDGNMIKYVETSNGRVFVAFRQPLLLGDPAPLVELLFNAEAGELYAYRRIFWREPTEPRTSYDTKYAKRMRRDDRIYYFGEHGKRRVEKLKELIELLPAE